VFSPDGDWIAYTSDESGAPRVYVTADPAGGGRVQVSRGEASFDPAWRADGRELHYQDQTALWAVPISWEPGPRPGAPRKVFEGELRHPLGFAVNDDGRVFYVVEIDLERWRSREVDVVLRWTSRLPVRD
jgi:hypothetical protein